MTHPQTAASTRPRNIGRLATVLIVLAIVPFVVVAMYAQPSYDDWCSAQHLRDLGFRGAFEWWYRHWTGRFTAILAWNVIPISEESLTGYRVAPVLLLAALYGGIAALCRAITRGWPGVTRSRVAQMAAGFLAAYLTVMPSPAEGFYWYTGWAVTTLGVVLALPAIAAAVNCLSASSDEGARTWMMSIIAAVFAFAAAGTNEIMTILLGLTFTGLAWTARRTGRGKRWQLLIVPFCAVAAAGLIDVMAPGNYVRAETARSLRGGIGPIVGAAAFAASGITSWVSSTTLLIGALLLLLSGVTRSPEVAPDSTLRRTHWATPVVFSAGAIWAIYAFTHWASGFSFSPGPPPRVMNIALVAWMTCGAITALLAGVQMSGVRTFAAALQPARHWILLLFAISLFGEGRVRVAYEDLVSGRARAYRDQLDARHRIARAASGKRGEVVVPPLERAPATLLFKDITTDAAHPHNGCYAAFWKVDRIRLSSE